MNGLVNVLKRLKTVLSTQKLQRLVIVRDNRVPLGAAAKVAKKLLEELEQDPRTVTVRPMPEVLAALDALRALLSDAKSGDLSCEGESVPSQTLEEWLLTNLPDGLRDLADSVVGTTIDGLGAQQAEAQDLESLHTLLSERPMVKLDEAVEALQRSREQLTALIQKYPDQIGLLAGSPEVLFRTVSTTSQHE
jgi:hypothetical protein